MNSEDLEEKLFQRQEWNVSKATVKNNEKSLCNCFDGILYATDKPTLKFPIHLPGLNSYELTYEFSLLDKLERISYWAVPSFWGSKFQYYYSLDISFKYYNDLYKYLRQSLGKPSSCFEKAFRGINKNVRWLDEESFNAAKIDPDFIRACATEAFKRFDPTQPQDTDNSYNIIVNWNSQKTHYRLLLYLSLKPKNKDESFCTLQLKPL